MDQNGLISLHRLADQAATIAASSMAYVNAYHAMTHNRSQKLVLEAELGDFLAILKPLMMNETLDGDAIQHHADVAIKKAEKPA